MRIGNIDTNDRVLVIAEVGNNHEGDFALAKDLVYLAKKAGADAIKFQTFSADLFVRQQDQERLERMRRFELKHQQFAELAALARAEGLIFLSTPLDMPALEFLGANPDSSALKIASGDNTFLPLIQRAAGYAKPLIISTGLADQAEILRALATVRHARRNAPNDPGLALLHCVCNYPVPDEQANLNAIPALKALVGPGITIGYSDHTIGLEAAISAVGLGARIIEKHFTIAKNHSDFRDHQLSADPKDMAELIQRIRDLEAGTKIDINPALLGNGTIGLQPCEQEMVIPVRRSVVAAHDLQADSVISLTDLTWMRPGIGIPPGLESDLLVGRRLRHPVAPGQAITLIDLKE